MTTRKLSDYSTDELLYELLKLTRRQQWESDPLRFGCEVFSQHFSKPPAPMHRAILQLVTAVATPLRHPEPSPEVGEFSPPMNTQLPFPPSLSVPTSLLSHANA